MIEVSGHFFGRVFSTVYKLDEITVEEMINIELCAKYGIEVDYYEN